MHFKTSKSEDKERERERKMNDLDLRRKTIPWFNFRVAIRVLSRVRRKGCYREERISFLHIKGSEWSKPPGCFYFFLQKNGKKEEEHFIQTVLLFVASWRRYETATFFFAGRGKRHTRKHLWLIARKMYVNPWECTNKRPQWHSQGTDRYPLKMQTRLWKACQEGRAQIEIQW